MNDSRLNLKHIISPDAIRNIQLNILKHFIDVCEQNSIRYFLAYGSMLGAIRHNGFIPWDDDIDVMVLRDDVHKLISFFNNGKYSIINSKINKKYFSPLLKAYDSSTLLIQDYGQNEGLNLGVYIDVFVLDKVPSDEIYRKKFYKKADDYRFKWALSCSRFNSKSKNAFVWFVKKIISIPYKIIGSHHFAMKYDRFASSYNNDNYLYGIVVYGEGFDKEYAYTEQDLENIEVMFEGIKVLIPKSYDLVLKRCYGEYMELPPTEERKKHSFKAYYRN